MINLTPANFQKEVLDQKDPIVVVFGNFWHSKTKKICELLESEKINYCFLDIDDQSEIAMKYSIRTSPLVQVLKEGQVIAIISSEFKIDKLRQILSTGLGN